MPRKPSGIMPCTNEDCRYPTRPERWKIADYPNTRLRRRGLCWKCAETAFPPPPKKEKNRDEGPPRPETVAALETFLAARHKREAARARRQYPQFYRKATA